MKTFRKGIKIDTYWYSLEHGSWVTLISKNLWFAKLVASEKSSAKLTVSEAPVPISM